MSEPLPGAWGEAGPAPATDAGPADGLAAIVAAPFSRYPAGGRALLSRIGGANARREYGRRLQMLTGERMCAYCGFDLYALFENWLLLQVDHVVPTGMARRLGIPVAYTEIAINLVLACAGCNGFDTRYVDAAAPRANWDLDAFLDLRDATFAVRYERIAARRARERDFSRRSAPACVEPDAADNETSKGRDPCLLRDRPAASPWTAASIATWLGTRRGRARVPPLRRTRYGASQPKCRSPWASGEERWGREPNRIPPNPTTCW